MNPFRYDIHATTTLKTVQHFVFKFENNYGASIIYHERRTSGQEKYELAVVYWEDDNTYNISYSTPITDEIIRDLSIREVDSLLHQIKHLED